MKKTSGAGKSAANMVNIGFLTEMEKENSKTVNFLPKIQKKRI